MSQFFDQASLVMIPSGYKTGKVYSQKPLSADGELTFTRASNASRVNADGLIEKVRTNLLTYSQDFSNVIWSKGNVTITGSQTDPNGGTTATSVDPTNAANGTVKQSIPITSGITYTWSVYIKGSTTGQSVALYTDGASNVYSKKDITTSWQRFTMQAPATSSGYSGFYILCGSAYSGLTDLPFDIAFAQVEASDFGPTDYIPTTSAAVSVGPVSGLPRLDYSGGCPSLLLEPQTTALNTNSEVLSNWTQTGTTTTANQIVSPDGYQNADLVAATNAVGNRVEQTGFSLSGSHTFSIFLKKGTSTRSLWYDGGKGVQIDWAVDGTPTVTAFSGGPTPASFGSVDYGNGWHRVWFQDTYSGTYVMRLFPDRIGTTGTVYAWGANLTATSYLQSYITTLGSAVTRLADSALLNNSAALPTDYPFTLYAEVDIVDPSGSGEAITFLNAGSPQNYFSLMYYSNIWVIASRPNGTTSLFNTTIAPTAGRHKVAGVFTSTSLKIYLDGVLIGTGFNGETFNAAINDLLLGQLRQVSDSGTRVPTRQSIVFKSALTDQQCIELTTL